MKRIVSLLTAMTIILTVFAAAPLSASALEETASAETETATETNTYPTESSGIDAAATGAEPTEISMLGETPTAEPEPAPTEAVRKADDYPVITKIENLTNGVKITWDAYKNNQRYRIYYRKAAKYSGTWDEKYKNGGWTRLSTVQGTSYTHTGVSDAEIGIYTVRCVDDKGDFTSEFNESGWENCYYAAPVINSLRFDEEGVHLSWTPAWEKHGFYSGELYRVYRKNSSGDWIKLTQTDGNTYTDDTAVPGSTYTYTLRMTDENGSFISGHTSGKSVSFNAYTLVTKIENTETGAKLTWLKYSGASKYRVYCKTSSGWNRIAQVSGTSYTDTAVKNGETRVYTVRALNSSDDFISDFKSAGWKNRYFAAPAIKSLSNSVTGVKLTWSRTDGAGDYRVYRKTSDGWQRLAQTNASEYTDTTAVSGKKYTYTLRIVDRDTDEFMSDYLSGKSITYVAAPVVKDVTNLENGAKLTWDKVAGANYYRIYYWNGKSWVRLASKYLTEYVDTSVKDGETREYTIRCLDANDNFVSDYRRDGYINTFYAPPVIKSLQNEEDGVVISWNRAKGAEDYRVYRKTAGSSWTRLTQTDQSSYTDTTAENGVKYTYTLRMIDRETERFMSDYNGGKSITRQGIPLFTSITNGADGVNLRWSTFNGAASYRVYYKNGSDWTRLTTTTGTSFIDTSIKDGETRTYTIRCLDSSGDFSSDFKRAGWVHTYIAPPFIGSVSYEDGHYTITWSQQAGVSTYRVYRRHPGDDDWTRIADAYEGSSFTDAADQTDRLCTYTLRAQDRDGNLISSFIPNNPYYLNGSAVNGAATDSTGTYYFIEGQLANGYYTVDGSIEYYQTGVLTEEDWYEKGVYSRIYSRSEWLFELMCCAGEEPGCEPDDAASVFALAHERGIIGSYTEDDYHEAVTRRFAANTLVAALGYTKRSVGAVSDLSSSDTALNTVAYYGYFLPDNSNKLYPTAQVTAEEFDRLISQLRLYRQLSGKTVLSFGDSIMHGAGNSSRGPASILGEKYHMYFYDYAVNGAAMGKQDNRNHIPDQIRKAIADNRSPDLILIDGGTNDYIWSIALGSMSEGSDMSAVDESTYSGGFEKAMWLLYSNWKNVPVIYIRAHDIDLGSDAVERQYGNRGEQIAAKWHAAVIDLYNDSGMNTEIRAIRDRYTYDNPDRGGPDAIHPNALGYATFYMPPVEAVTALTFGE